MPTANSQTRTKQQLEDVSLPKTKIWENISLNMKCGIQLDRKDIDRWLKCTTKMLSAHVLFLMLHQEIRSKNVNNGLKN